MVVRQRTKIFPRANCLIFFDLDEVGENARIGEAKAVMKRFKMMVCPVAIRHRPQFQAAAEKGKSVIEAGC